MKVIHLKVGWSNPDFQDKLNGLIKTQEEEGFEYYDIKISSSSENCLVILKKKSSEK